MNLKLPSTALERALVFNFLIHGIAMLAMVAMLLPALPGGTDATDAQRVAYLATHPWSWRLGWLTWQLTALADLVFSIAIVRARWIPRLPAIVALALTVAAILPDQTAQAMLVARGVDVAQDAVKSGDTRAFLAFEHTWFPLTSAWAATFYTLGAIAWTWCFAAARTWNRWLTLVSIAAWGAFGVVSVGAILPESLRLPARVVAAGNAIGFVLLEVWFAMVFREVRKGTASPAQSADPG